MTATFITETRRLHSIYLGQMLAGCARWCERSEEWMLCLHIEVRESELAQLLQELRELNNQRSIYD